MKLKCDDCEREVECSPEHYASQEGNFYCKKCKGNMVKIEEEDSEDEEIEEEDLEFQCNVCGEAVAPKDCINFEAGDIAICKKHIDKVYPRPSTIEYKEKIVEKPIYVTKYVTKDSSLMEQSNIIFRRVL